MDIITILRIGGYGLAGLGAGYWASLLLCRCAASGVVHSRRRMALLGGMAGIGLAAITAAIAPSANPALETLTTPGQMTRALANSAGTPIVVDFYADWCPPCKTMGPLLEELQQRWGGRVKFYKVNVDEAIQLKQRYDVRSIPTLIYFQGNQEVDRTIGMVGPAQIETRLVRMIENAGTSSRVASSEPQPSSRP